MIHEVCCEWGESANEFSDSSKSGMCFETVPGVQTRSTSGCTILCFFLCRILSTSANDGTKLNDVPRCIRRIKTGMKCLLAKSRGHYRCPDFNFFEEKYNMSL